MNLNMRGERVNIRRLKRADAKSMFENARDFEMAQYTTLPHPYKLEHATGFIKITHRNIRNRSEFVFGIECKEEKKIVGTISLMKVDESSKNAEVGFWLGKKYWGKKFAKEALELILNFGFKDLKLVRIYARVMHPNIASMKLLEGCGFKYEGRMKKASLKKGRWYDDLMYAILDEQYGKVKTK